MNYEVVVIGGGLGGLTVAALLAARGVNVCLLERQSRVGGCVASVEHPGFQFDPTFGLYRGWENGGIYDRVFSELGISAPQVKPVSPHYIVRLPDGVDIPLVTKLELFEHSLVEAFPECSEAAIEFYREVARAAQRSDLPKDGVAAHLQRCSFRFRRFIDAQLQTFVQRSSDECSYDEAVEALNLQSGFWDIEGGAQALANALAKSLKESGGALRLNSPVLRLAYGADQAPVGVDLLSGERVVATRAIVSNLTVWDTFGKLVGMSKTPPTISSQLKRLDAWGVYLVFLSLDRSAAPRLPSRRIVALTDWQENQSFDPEQTHFVFSVPSDTDARAPEGKLAVTLSAFTNAQDWFSFHEDHAAHEEQDQAMLESLWSRLHAAIPELGDSAEVIETATPQTFYDSTRRKFGMIGRPDFSIRDLTESVLPGYRNLFLVGDTVARGLGLAGVVEAASNVADSIAQKNK
jgi:prolycopene isomerase